MKLQWEDVYNAQKYQIQLSSSVEFKVNLLDSILVSATEVQFIALNNNTTYFWHVNAINDKALSGWSETRNFTTKLETPQLLTPSDGDTNIPLNVKLMWTSSPGAKFYQIQIASDLVFKQIANKSDKYSANIYIPDNMVSETKYYWRILGFNANNESDWSDISTFTIVKITDVNDNNTNLNDFIVFPNPASDNINIQLKKDVQFKVKLFSGLGEEIFSGENVQKIDLKNFSSGLINYQLFFGDKINLGSFILAR